MAYAALASLVQTLQELLRSDQHQLPLHYPEPQIESLYKKLCSLQSSLDKIIRLPQSIRKKVDALENEIRDVSHKAQDTIEAFLSRQIHEPEPEDNALQIPESIDDFLQEMMDKIDSKTAAAEEIVGSIDGNKEDPQTGDGSSSEDAPSAGSGSRRKIVGQEKDKKDVTEQLIGDTSKELRVVPIVGMAGIGKTTLARSIYDDPRIVSSFQVRGWVTVPQEYNVKDILSKLLRDMEKHGQKSEEVSEDSGDLSIRLHHKLFEKRYLIVIDDMWDKDVWDKVRQYFKDDKKGSRILLTTRYGDVAEFAKPEGFHHKMSLLDKENSWKLLCQTVFGDGPCLPDLEKIGRGISDNCKGLPLSLVVVGGLLYKEKRTRDYWEIVAEDTNAAAEKNVGESYVDILFLSYNHLPGRLKGCFLYMGAFPEDSEILIAKLIRLWVAEGFVASSSSPHRNLEQVAEHFLEDLFDRNLLSARQRTSHGRTKTCGMHDTLRDLAKKESQNQKFFYSLYRYKQVNSQAGKKTQRRLAVHKNIIICMENGYKFAKSFTFSHTLLYVGQHHHHPQPYCLTFELLRVLDAYTIYFISFPTEIVKLIHLRYLSMTYNGRLQNKSVSKLRNLQVLIVRRHPRIILVGASFLPEDLWNMPQLRHILFSETCLPDLSGAQILSKNTSALLSNLQTLSNVNAACLTKEVLQNMPNLRKLVAWIEAPIALELDLRQLELQTFKFAVLKPVPRAERESLPKIFYPESLKKLTLSGCAFPWDYMTDIGKLPNLESLKLREVSFQGKEWEPEEGEFRELKFLLLEYLELESWGATHKHLPLLEQLILIHCYELKEMCEEIGDIGPLELIQLVDCSTDARDWAEYIKEKQEEAGNNTLQVHIYSSWE